MKIERILKCTINFIMLIGSKHKIAWDSQLLKPLTIFRFIVSEVGYSKQCISYFRVEQRKKKKLENN